MFVFLQNVVYVHTLETAALIYSFKGETVTSSFKEIVGQKNQNTKRWTFHLWHITESLRACTLLTRYVGNINFANLNHSCSFAFSIHGCSWVGVGDGVGYGHVEVKHRRPRAHLNLGPLVYKSRVLTTGPHQSTTKYPGIANCLLRGNST